MIHGAEDDERATPGAVEGEGEHGAEGAAEQPEAAGYRVLLAAWLDRVEARLERLLAMGEADGERVRALTRHLTAPPTATATDERLAELLTVVDALHQQLEALGGALSRQNRVQFKTNALLDGKAEEVAQALSVLQELATRRDQATSAREAEEARRRAELRAEGRAELAADLLPVLDGIERALESGAALLEQPRAAPRGRRERPGLVGALLRALAGRPPPPPPRQEARPHDALAAWLEGLMLGRERFLELLAGEGIRPVPALALPFDPRFQVAVATEAGDDVPPGTVVRVLRTGYRRGEHPVRFAEVVVARSAGDAGAGKRVEAHDATDKEKDDAWRTGS